VERILGDRTGRDTISAQLVHVLVLPEGYYASPKRIVKALEAMKHQKGMKKGFSLAMSEVDHKASASPISQDPSKSNISGNRVVKLARVLFGK
jgi:hypothetical protein